MLKSLRLGTENVDFEFNDTEIFLRFPYQKLANTRKRPRDHIYISCARKRSYENNLTSGAATGSFSGCSGIICTFELFAFIKTYVFIMWT